MATAKQLPSGNWRCQVYEGMVDGKRQYKSFTGRNRIMCEREATLYENRMKGLRDGTSVEAALEDYVSVRRSVLSPATVRGYNNIVRYFKNEQGAFCALPVASLEKRELQSVINEMVHNGDSAKTIGNRMGLVFSAMRDKDVQVPRVKLPTKQRPDLHIPDTKDVQKIIKASEGTEMEIPILLAAFAPMRRSEICALTMDDIDGDTIHVRHAIVMNEKGENVIKGTKTYQSNRYIPMDKSIMDKIRKKGYITKIENPQHISQRFEHIAKKAGCEGVRFHDLRHWCASYLHAQGVPDTILQARGGWRTDRILKSVYLHELESESSKWTQTINNNFEDILKSV